MDSNSWMRLREESPQYRLSPAQREADRLGARDCGWVEQMRPFVAQLSRPGELVLDPFCGFGTTLLAAALEGRRGIGFEVDASRVRTTRERLASHGISADLRHGSIDEYSGEIPAVDLCLTSIPYFGCGWPDAGTGAAQLYASGDYAGYLQRIGSIFQRVHRVLGEGRYCIAMAENLSLDGRMVPLAWDVARLLSERFELLEERVILYDKPAAPLAPLTLASNRSHEFALVLRKARPKVDLEATAALLRDLAAQHHAFMVYGSFADWLRGRVVVPADADLLVSPEETTINALLAALAERGFHLTSWGDPVALPLRMDQYRGRYYFRARRLGHAGSFMQLDIGFEVGEPWAGLQALPPQWIAGIPLLAQTNG